MSAAGHRALHAGLVGMVMAIAGVVSVVTASPASAHANLERSDPATGEVLAQSPSSVTMIFTEPPDPGLSAVEIVNAAGQPVQTGPVTAGAAARSLQVGLPADLPDGIYTVSWQVLSEADGHWSADAFAFGVGVDPDTVPPPSADARRRPVPRPCRSRARSPSMSASCWPSGSRSRACGSCPATLPHGGR